MILNTIFDEVHVYFNVFVGGVASGRGFAAKGTTPLRRGSQGGGALLGDHRGQSPSKKTFWCFCVYFLAHGFSNGFLILVKELRLLTNTGQWIRGFGCHEIIYILYCKQ
jgi:hypothetical protein